MKEETAKVVYYAEMDSPIGTLTIASTTKGLCWLDFGKNENTLFSLTRWAKKWLNTDKLIKANNELDTIINQLNDYFSQKRKKFYMDIDLYGTPFQKVVWESLLTIPYGEVRSYKDIAIQINAHKSVRAIGGANHKNPIPVIVPCHRVIGTNGNLVGYGGGLDIKKQLLVLEGYKMK